MRLNNKGFAISGVLYSMLILIITLMFLVLGILAGRRTTLSKIGNESQQSVEDRVVTREKTVCSAINFDTSTLYAYDSAQLEREVVLEPGYYLIQAWGAGGANYINENNFNSSNPVTRKGGKGAYVATIYYTESSQKIYINLGGTNLKQPYYSNGSNKNVGDVKTRYNGGGVGTAAAGDGGGATSVATVSGELKTLKNNTGSIILVAAGGGGASYATDGGAGGNLENGKAGKGGTAGVDIFGGKGATNVSGGAGGLIYGGVAKSAGKAGSFGQGGDAGVNSTIYVGGGGGGGYYGGGGGTSYGGSRYGSGGGGVSYINSSLLAFTKRTLNNNGVFMAKEAYKKYIGVGINGDSVMPQPGTTTTNTMEILTQTQTGNSTSGYVRITKLTCQTYID